MALTRITQGVIKPNENYDTHNINSTGIVTATGLDISGNASISGVLTYEDVNNIDSIGIITARSDIKVGTAITLTSAGAGFYAGIVTASSFKLPDGSNVGGVESDSGSNTVGGTDAGGAGGPDPNYASFNSFFGALSGNSIGGGDSNTCIGYKSGEYITSGHKNTSVGTNSLYRVTQSDKNTAIGNNCLRFLSGGAGENVAIGHEAAGVMSGGSQNVAIGALSVSGSTGNATGNVAIGYDALPEGATTTCNYNVAIGHKVKRVEGNNNEIAVTSGMVAIGRSAAYDIRNATNSIFIGYDAGASLTISSGGTYGNSVNTNCIVIGANANPSDNQTNNEITLGDTNITNFRIPGIGVTFATSGNHISGITTFADDIKLPDEKNIFLGTDSDLQIFHTNSGNQSFIKASGAKLTITAAALDINNAADSEILAKFIQDGSVQLFYDYSSHNTPKLQTSATGVIVDGTVTDSKGNLRSIPLNTQSSAYTLVAADAGKVVLASGNITIADSVFSAGDAVTIINNTNGDITINKGSVLYYTVDGTSANRTLATRGMATIYFTHNTTGYISGAGLS